MERGIYRHYPSLHEMNKDLTSNINKIVRPEDTLYHLGDWSFGGIDTAIRMLGVARPFSVSEIIDIMDKQSLEFPDHHDLSTNTGKPQGRRGRH